MFKERMYGLGSRCAAPTQFEPNNYIKGLQVQSYNSAAIAWGALGKPLYATGTRYGVCISLLRL
jgi:hypothetical protein